MATMIQTRRHVNSTDGTMSNGPAPTTGSVGHFTHALKGALRHKGAAEKVV